MRLFWLFFSAAVAASATADFDDAADYDFDPTAVRIADGTATLFPVVAGTGGDGALSVSDATWDLSTQASAGRTVADGASWSVSGATTDALTLSGYTDGLAVGDELLVLAIQGSPSATTGVGEWELGSASGSSCASRRSPATW
jgi:hypothetical protein